MCAYRSDQYASSLAGFGRPRRLERSGGWVLEQPIPGLDDRDAMGCYPLFACERWGALEEDLTALGDLVSLVLVADPFGDFDSSRLDSCFNRGLVPFKRHHVVELGPPVERLASAHHRRNARKALGLMEVERVQEPERHLDDWIGLYEGLIRRHEIRGVAAFSAFAFARQFETPGLVAFRAEADGATIGMLLWLVQGDVAYYHLGAYDEAGYARNASFALFWWSIEWFTGRVRWLELGAGAGAGAGSGGLDRFKGGWATGTRTAYLGRHVFQPDRYEAIASSRGTQHSAYFPSYRAGEYAASPSPALKGCEP
jgi:Acetyltransferase (GNAT) domain